MDCLVAAGGVPGEGDLLYECTQGAPKAMLNIAGRPMVEWVLDALSGACQIDRVVMVGLGSDSGITSRKLADTLPDQGSLLRNIVAGVDRVLELNPDARQVVMCSADIPLITPEMVDGFVSRCVDPSVSLYYGVVPRALMESRFPESRRSYVHLKDGDFAGADMSVFDPQIAYTRRELWDDLIGHRKSALKQARRIGLGLLVRLLMRRLDIADAERQISRSLGLTGRAVIVPHAELGMDVDKPFQLAICRRALSD